jgi:Spy/CpxP family protein refolding chaperone
MAPPGLPGIVISELLSTIHPIIMETLMRRLLPFVVAFAATSTPVFSQNAPAKQAPAATPATAPADTARALEELRGDLQAKRADIMAKNISLSADQAAKFWPLYEKYQAEQNAIIDAQLKGVKEYAEKYEHLDDAGALAFIDVQMKRDEAMVALRRKWLPEFQKILPTTTAVRVIQIDRRLSQAMQVVLSSQLPLVR